MHWGPTVIIHANLDVEARWANVTLPRAVRERISLLGALVAALAPLPSDACEVWTPAPIDRARLLGFPIRAAHVGAPPRADLAWARTDDVARAVNDRRFALALGLALPGTCVVHSLSDLDDHLRAFDPPQTRAWIVKAPLTAAGRDRHRAVGPLVGEGRARVANLLARAGALVFEPYCERIADFGACATVDADGQVHALAPHGLAVDARGGFVGIARPAADLAPDEATTLAATVTRVGAALAARGYAGPFAIDAFAYRDPVTHARRFHPLCEINARYSFGWIARALGATQLGLAGPPPPGARVLIAPTAHDPTTAWLTSSGA